MSRYLTLEYIRITDEVLNSTPLLKDVRRVITPDYAAHWKVIGALLGLPTTCLDETETANPTNLQWCCNDMLKMWLARNTNATWKDVLVAIDSPTLTQSVPSSSDIPQSDPLNANQLIPQLSDFVKTNYVKGRYYSKGGIWQLLHPKHFDNALWIHRLEGRGEKEVSNIAALMREGLTGCTHQLPPPDNVQSELDGLEMSHNIADAFKSFDKRNGTTVTPEVIVISGAPGMGKTTLCKEMAYQWAKGQFLDNSCLVFFVYLRDPEAQKICDLQSFVHYFFNFDKAAAEFSKQCADLLTERSNEDITIILVGYDEYYDVPGDLFLTDMINQKVSCFAHSKLVITCGPIATDKLQHVADVKVDLLGFTNKSKKTYIQKELQGSPDKIEKLCLFLDENSAINNICTVPMIMSILVYIFKEVNDLSPDKAALYEYFITLTILKYLENADKSDFKALCLQQLPECYQQYIVELSKLAFTLKDDKIVFSKEDLETLCPTLAAANKNFSELGLLKSAVYFNMKGIKDGDCYKFLHSAIQEFLTAYYINSLKPSAQFELLKKTFFVKRYTSTWLLFVDSNKNIMYQFSKYLIHGTPCKDLKVNLLPKIADLDPFQAFTQLAIVCTKDSSLTHSKLLCYKSSGAELLKKDSLSMSLEKVLLSTLIPAKSDWNKVYISLCSAGTTDNQPLETFMVDKTKQEGVYAKVASYLSESTHLSVEIINAVSMVAYRATKQQIIDGFDMNDSFSCIFMKQCTIDDKIAEKASLHFSKNSVAIAAFIGCTFNNDGHIMILNCLSTISTLQIFMLDNSNIDETTAVALSSVIANNIKLSVLELFNCKLQKNAGIIAAALKNISTITTLTLSDNKIPGSVADDLAIAIYVNCNLQRLRLADNNLQHQGAVVASALCQIRTLVELNLNNNNMTEKVADELSLAIESNKSLQVLHIGGNNLKSDGIIRIAASVSCLSTLQSLEIHDNQITEEAADAIATAICSNVRLKLLNLNNNLLKNGVGKVAHALHFNNIRLETLGLSGNKIPEQSAEALAAAIKSNHLLEVLNLSNNNFYSYGIITIAQSLANLSSLKYLNVSNNKISCDAADAIASVILANSQLETLYLSENFLGTGIKVIANALKHISNLKKIDVNDNQIPECAAEELAGALLGNKRLRIVAVAENNLKTKGIETISQALSNLSELQTYSIYNNYGSEDASDAISSVILNNRNLKSVHVSGNNLQAGIIKVGNALNFLSIEELNFKYSNISEEAAASLALAVSNQHCLKTLVLEGNTLGAKGIIPIAKSLCSISKLNLLNLYDTFITEEAADSIALAISSNPGLEQLYLGSNKLCTGAKKVAAALAGISSLKVLDLNDNEMSEAVASKIALAIKSNFSLEDLRLRNNKLTSSGIITIAQSLSNISTLKSLNIRNNHVTELAVDALSSLISNNTGIEQLWLGNNSFQTGIVKILKALETAPNLKTLDFDNSITSSDVFQQIISFVGTIRLGTLYLEGNDLRSCRSETLEALCQNTSFKTIDLNNTSMKPEMADMLADIISNNSSLQNLWIRSNNLKSDKVIKIAKSLSTLTTLNGLNLQNNQITEEAVDAIISIIMQNDTLEELYLGNNNLGTGVSAILTSLHNVPTLKKLFLYNNSMPDKVCTKITGFLANSHLIKLDLAYNCFRLSGKHIAQALAKIITLTYLNLNNCYMTDQVATDLAAAILSNSSLKYLYLSKNMLRTSGVISVCQSLKSLSTLKELGIQGNEATEMAADAIGSVISANSSITNVYLAGNKLRDKAVTVMKALQTVSSLVVLYLDHMEMTEIVTTDLAVAINSNPSLERLFIACNLLSNSLIEVVKACKNSLRNLLTLDLQYNVVHPSVLSDLASVTGTINSLEALSIGGLSLSLDEKIFNYFKLNLDQIFSTRDAQSIDQSQTLEILNFELQRQMICEVIKLNYDLNYLLLNCADPMIRTNYPHLVSNSTSFNTSLQKTKHQLLQVDAASIIHLLSNISKLKILNLEQSNVDEIAAFELAGILSCNNVLERLWLGSNQLGCAGAMFILNSLKYISTLKVLDLSFNNIGNLSAEGVAAVIHGNQLLEQIWLDGNKLTDIGVIHICCALKCITRLRILSLYSNEITDDAAEELSNVISANNLLQDLSFGYNKLKSNGLCKIAHALNKLNNLRKLDLLNNSVTTLAAQALAISLSNCYTLQELYLSDNMLETDGAIKIFESLKQKSKLHVLTLSNNNITDEAIDELCLVLAQNPRLQILLLGGNKLQTDGAVRIAQVVKCENTIMRLLGLCENDISEQGKEQVKMRFSDNTLIHVYL